VRIARHVVRPLLSGRLVATTVPVASLDAATREAMWRLYADHYDRVEAGTFFADLDAKDDVILVRDAADDSVQGFTTLQVYPHESAQRRFVIVFSGDTIIAPKYQGQSALQRAFVRYVMGAVLAARGAPVYWYLISKGFKTYLLLSRNFLEYWPRHDQPTPPEVVALQDELGRKRFGRAYRAPSEATAEADLPRVEASASQRARVGIVRWDPPGPRLKAGVAPIEARALAAADVRFFLAVNPGHEDGDELCCLGRLDLAMGMNYLGRWARRVLGRRR
jgi:hypothetical protein